MRKKKGGFINKLTIILNTMVEELDCSMSRLQF